MICPECGERYNYYEPQCPWCGAAKPAPEKELPDWKSRQQLEDKPAAVEEKEVFFTYKARKKLDGKILLLFSLMPATPLRPCAK